MISSSMLVYTAQGQAVALSGRSLNEVLTYSENHRDC